jgi:protein O-mannosyl-transferase
MNPSRYHLTSLLIHSVNALLCYALAYRLLELGFGARPRDLRLAAAVAALFFALHPLRVESVAWIAERRDVLMGLFAVALLPDDVTAGGRARRLAMAMAPRDPVTCAP